jgi:hypothetical protein
MNSYLTVYWIVLCTIIDFGVEIAIALTNPFSLTFLIYDIVISFLGVAISFLT